jgi:hypothetical protein
MNTTQAQPLQQVAPVMAPMAVRRQRRVTSPRLTIPGNPITKTVSVKSELHRFTPKLNSFIQRNSNQGLVDMMAALGVVFPETGITRTEMIKFLKEAYKRAFTVRISHSILSLQGQPTGSITAEAIFKRLNIENLKEDLEAGVIAKIANGLDEVPATEEKKPE